VIPELAQLVLTTAPERRALVAVDGVDASGKTTLADALGAAVAPRREVVRASVDAFHRPRAERYRRGRASVEGCYRDTIDHDAVRHRLLLPFRDGGPCVTVAFDHSRDTAVEAEPVRPGDTAVLVVDGVFLQRPELDVGWDLVVHLQVPDEEVLRRAAARDGEHALPLYRERYLPAQRLYEQECRPGERADVLVDNTDPEAPVVLHWPARGGSC
jgi:uridine kinase